jgi:hypothetical protein
MTGAPVRPIRIDSDANSLQPRRYCIGAPMLRIGKGYSALHATIAFGGVRLAIDGGAKMAR